MSLIKKISRRYNISHIECNERIGMRQSIHYRALQIMRLTLPVSMIEVSSAGLTHLRKSFFRSMTQRNFFSILARGSHSRVHHTLRMVSTSQIKFFDKKNITYLPMYNFIYSSISYTLCSGKSDQSQTTFVTVSLYVFSFL